MKAQICVLAAALALVACDKQEEPTRATTPATPATTAGQADKSGATEPASVQADDSDVPTEQDFEDEAQQKVSSKNLEEELDKLEKEIGEGG